MLLPRLKLVLKKLSLAVAMISLVGMNKTNMIYMYIMLSAGLWSKRPSCFYGHSVIEKKKNSQSVVLAAIKRDPDMCVFSFHSDTD